MEDKYSVLMSVYKKEKPEFLKISINSMLNQTIRPSDIVIVKDGPLTDELDTVLEKFVNENPDLFQIISLETNQGLGLALAAGIIKTKYELVARMDSDDFSVKNRCEEQLKVFSEQPDVEVVGTFEAEFTESIDNVVAIHKVPENSDDIAKFMKRRCALLHPTVMYKKSSVLRCGNYHSVILYEDYDLFARMVLDYGIKCYNIQLALYNIRINDDFYKRRGGLKYAKTVLNFKFAMFKKGYMSLADFIVSGFGQALVCILPNRVRKMIYMNFLRK